MAKSLYFQFYDQPLSVTGLLAKLWEQGLGDSRYLRIWKDVDVEVSHGLRSLLAITELSQFSRLLAFSHQSVNKSDSPDGNLSSNTAERLWKAQSSLYYRAVSVSKDEPLCLATLLSLDMSYISQADDGDERMARVWELLDKEKAVPSRVIFYVENPLPVPGYGWAPQSLLSSAESTLSHDDVTARLNSLLTFGASYSKDSFLNQPAVITDFGLKVEFPGLVCTLKPWWEGGPVNPWNGLMKGSEHSLLAREDSTGKWFRMVDFFRGREDSTLTPEMRAKLDEADPRPLFNDLVRGKTALIKDVKSEIKGGPTVYLMVRLRGDHSHFPKSFENPNSSREPEELFVEVRRAITLIELDRDYSLMMDIFREVGVEVNERRIVLDANSNQDLKDDLKKLMKKLVAEAWDLYPSLEKGVIDNFGPGMKERAWALLPILLPYDLVLGDLAPNQSWVVDRIRGRQ